ncbi:MAG: DUF5131 family protein [Pseudomonadota bacterium]
MIDILKGRFWDKPWSLVDGCTPCSPGCEHCWAAAMEDRFRKNKLTDLITGKFFGAIMAHPDRLSVPQKRRKPTVYAVWNDLFHEAVPDIFIKEVIDVIQDCPQHIFLVLTKRPKRMVHYFNTGDPAWPSQFPVNAWSGLTVCNQQEADEKIPVFLQVPGKKFLSIEPCLGGIKLFGDDYDWTENGRDCKKSCINSVILGGETGPGARPMHPDWVRSVRDQCQSAGVPFFFKQWGEWLPVGEMPTLEFKPIGGNDALSRFHLWGDFDKNVSMKIGRKAAGRLLDGKEHDDLPWRAKP